MLKPFFKFHVVIKPCSGIEKHKKVILSIQFQVWLNHVSLCMKVFLPLNLNDLAQNNVARHMLPFRVIFITSWESLSWFAFSIEWTAAKSRSSIKFIVGFADTVKLKFF